MLGLFAAVSAACAGIACAGGSDFVPSARTGAAIQQAIDVVGVENLVFDHFAVTSGSVAPQSP